MKLAEALIQRASMKKEMDELKSNIHLCLTVEEGETPEEGVETLMTRFTELINEQTELIGRINLTNATTKVADGTFKGATLGHLIAQRDAVAQVKNQYQFLGQQTSVSRYGRTKDDVKFVLTFSPKQMREEADKLAKQYRELDTLIQGMNWTTDLV